MATTDDQLHARLDMAVKRRDALQASVQRVTGRLEAAQAELAAVEGECRNRNIDPTKLGLLIEQLEQRYETAVSQLEEQLTSAEANLAPFIKSA